MKRFLKYTLYALGSIIGLLLLLLAIVAFKPLPTYDVEVPDLQVELTPERIQTGKQISMVLCQHCHASESGLLEGKVLEAQSPLGPIAGPNITQHPTFGIGAYSDGELYRLLRTGIKRDGKLALPMMYKSRHLSEEDLYGIIAFLRSDAKEVQPSPEVTPPNQPSLLAKALFSLAFQPLDYPEHPVEAPLATDPIAYGKYLVQGRFYCYDCHSQSFETNNQVTPELSAGYLQGGNTFQMPGMPAPLTAPNITGDPEVGIGSWTEEAFTHMLLTGSHPDGRSLRYPMLPYPFLDSTDAGAIFQYLKTVPTEK